jgi:hypothetical protein
MLLAFLLALVALQHGRHSLLLFMAALASLPACFCQNSWQAIVPMSCNISLLLSLLLLLLLRLLLLDSVQVAFSAHTRHPNIVQLLDVFADKERRTLVIVVRPTRV